MKKELVREFLSLVKDTDLDFIDYKTLMKNCPSFKGMKLKDITKVINSLGYSTLSNYKGYRLVIDTVLSDWAGHNEYGFSGARLAWNVRHKVSSTNYYRVDDVEACMKISYPFFVFEEPKEPQNIEVEITNEMALNKLLENFSDEEKPVVQKFINNYCTLEYFRNGLDIQECEKDGTPIKPCSRYIEYRMDQAQQQKQGKYGDCFARVSIDKFFEEKKSRTVRKVNTKGVKND